MTAIFPYESPIGRMTMAADHGALTGLWFDGQKHDRRGLNLDEKTDEEEVFAKTVLWLDRYFAKEDPGELPPLRMEGSSFQKLIWQLLLEIPYGETTTYGELSEKAARRMGRERMSAQATGGAVGHNPVSVIVPCHRVVGKDGSLTGYAGGVEKKEYLLALEKEGVNIWKR